MGKNAKQTSCTAASSIDSGNFTHLAQEVARHVMEHRRPKFAYI